MKNRTSILLFCLVLVLAVFLVSCQKDEGSEGGATDTSVSVEQPSGAETLETEHELHDYFVLKTDHDTLDLSAVTQYGGELVDMDGDHQLLAMRTKDLDVKNQVIETVTVYDLVSGAVLHQFSATAPLAAASNERVELTVTLSYPVIRVAKTTYDSEGEPQYQVSYYAAKEKGAVLHTTDSNDFERWDHYNGLVSFQMGDKILWIDRNAEVIRTAGTVSATGHPMDGFQAEYQGYLYAWDDDTAQIFNRLGVCSGSYRMEGAGFLNVHLLDDGNLLVQELTEADDYSSCDFRLGNVRYRLRSFLMSYLDGAITELELPYLVDTLETGYAQRYKNNDDYAYLPFELAAGQDNQAVIYRFSAGELSLYAEYVVLSNGLEIQYTLDNTQLGLDPYSIRPVSEGLYVAKVAEDGIDRSYLFDLDGNRLTALAGDKVTVSASYLVTELGIYDKQMNLLYDLTEGEFAGGLVAVDPEHDRIYVEKHNFITGADEVYLLDVAAKTATPLADGVNARLFLVGNGFYALRNPADGSTTFYDETSAEKLVVSRVSDGGILDEFLWISAEFEGKSVLFVVR